jgi:hypothetical protein
LNLLAQEIPRLASLKAFITTRPEQHIRNILASTHHERFHLHEIEHSVVEADIRLYLEYSLSLKMVQNALPELEPPWEPCLKDLDALVRAAGRLFIIASTAVLFLLDVVEYDPHSQMAKLLDSFVEEYTGKRLEQVLDDVYMQILRSAVPEGSGNHLVKGFRKVVGTIILLQDPLPLESLAGLLSMTISEIKRTLNHLHSIIAPGSRDRSPQVYHKSFPDFITDAERCRMDKRFFIAPEEHHSDIVAHCFRIMDRDLRENICELGFPERYLDNSEVHHLTEGKVSPELSYACLYWADHLSHAGVDNNELLQRVEDFILNHLLHWLEVLSLIRRLDVVHPAIERTKLFANAVSLFSILFSRDHESHKNNEDINKGFDKAGYNAQ